MNAPLKLYYVLLLEGDNYYVGVTDNLNRRLVEHKSEKGSAWTKLYKYVKVVEVGEITSEFEEDLQVKKYMKKYGIDHVRGGTYSTIFLEDNCKEFLQKEFNHASNNCLQCGKCDHYVKDCPSVPAKMPLKKTKTARTVTFVGCTRCKRTNHKVDECYATMSKTGKILCKGTTQKGMKCSKQARAGGYCKLHSK